MAIKANELRNKAKQIAAEQKSILDQATEKLTPEQEQRFNDLDKDFNTLIKQAEMIERAEKLELSETPAEEIVSNNKRTLKPEEIAQAEDLAMREYLRTGSVPQELRGFMAPQAAEKDDADYVNRTMKQLGLTRTAIQTTTTTGGGYTIPRGFMAELEKALLAYGGMWEAARIVKTSKGNVMDWPTVNDTSNKGYRLSESTSAATAAAAVTFGTTPLEAYKYTSGLVQIPAELLEDSEFNLAAEMIPILAERIWRITNEEFTTADGSSKPQGVVTGSVYGASSANDTALSYDDFVNLEHSVDPAYRRSPKTRFMFHDSVLREAKKIKDSQNMPVWNPGLMATGAPSTLFGYQYTINQDMAQFWAGNATDNDSDKAILFGDFSKYIIRQVREMRIVRLNERYADLDQVAFAIFMRADGTMLNAGTDPIKHLRISTT